MGLLAVAGLCLLIGIAPIRDCDKDAQVYTSQARQIPRDHLRMVGEIRMWNRDYANAAYPEMLISLPRFETPPKETLAHEVGHIVAVTLGLNEPYEDKFWPRGKPRGRTTGYGDTGPREDLAECYAMVVIKKPERCSDKRITWIKQHMFG